MHLPLVKMHARLYLLCSGISTESHQQSHAFFMRGSGCAFFYGRVIGMDKELYFQIFNKITDMIEELKAMQCAMEDAYISAEE